MSRQVFKEIFLKMVTNIQTNHLMIFIRGLVKKLVISVREILDHILSVSTSYKALEYIDVNVGINYFVSNMHYRQNSIDTLRRYYPNVVTKDEEFYRIKHNYCNSFYLTLGSSLKFRRFNISPSVDFCLGMIDCWNLERFNNEKLREVGFEMIPFNKSRIRVGLKLGYNFEICDKNFIVNAGFVTENLLLTLKMEL